MDEVCCPGNGLLPGNFRVNPVELAQLRFEAEAHLALFQELMSLPRETIPQLSAAAARKTLTAAASAIGLELTVVESVVPTFLLLPPGGAAPVLTVFASWHAEAHPVFPAAVEGAERLALLATVGAIGALRAGGVAPAAVIVAPAATQGSLPLSECLRAHRRLPSGSGRVLAPNLAVRAAEASCLPGRARPRGPGGAG